MIDPGGNLPSQLPGSRRCKAGPVRPARSRAAGGNRNRFRALEAEASCAAILNLAASIRGATNGLVVELLEDHLRNHVVDVESEALRTSGAEELIEVMRRHLK